jgi:hypothetical protein
MPPPPWPRVGTREPPLPGLPWPRVGSGWRRAAAPRPPLAPGVGWAAQTRGWPPGLGLPSPWLASPWPRLALGSGAALAWPARAPLRSAEFRGPKRKFEMASSLVGVRWLSAHLTSTFVTSTLTKVGVTFYMYIRGLKPLIFSFLFALTFGKPSSHVEKRVF